MAFSNISRRYEKENATHYLFLMTRCLGVYIHIHHLGLFTNIALKNTLALFANKVLSESVSTDSTIVRVDVGLIIRPQPNQTIGLT